MIRSKKFYERAFIAVILVSFAAWLVGIFAGGRLSTQFDLFFRNCEDFFADLVNVVGYSGQKNPYLNTSYSGLGEKAYPPLNYLITYLFSGLASMEHYYAADNFLSMYQEPRFLIVYLILSTVVVIAVYELVRTCKTGSQAVKVLTAAAVCASAPVLYSYERANFILLTLVFVLFFILYYDSENRVLRECALIALALAAALKLTPALLGILLLYKRQWKAALKAVLYGVLFGVGPFLFFTGGLSNIGQMLSNMSLNLSDYGVTDGATLTASIIGVGLPQSSVLLSVMKWVTYVVSILLLAAAPVYKNKWEMVMAVSLVLVIAPSHSGTYCLLYLIPAMVAFLNAQEHAYSDLVILFGVFLIMFSFQGLPGKSFLNYHLGLLLLTAVLTVRGLVRLTEWFRKRQTCNRERV